MIFFVIFIIIYSEVSKINGQYLWYKYVDCQNTANGLICYGKSPKWCNVGNDKKNILCPQMSKNSFLSAIIRGRTTSYFLIFPYFCGNLLIPPYFPEKSLFSLFFCLIGTSNDKFSFSNYKYALNRRKISWCWVVFGNETISLLWKFHIFTRSRKYF